LRKKSEKLTDGADQRVLAVRDVVDRTASNSQVDEAAFRKEG
jgi:hypothetical protein